MLSRKAKRELKIDQRQILIDSIEIGVPSPKQILIWGERNLPNGKKAGLVKNSKTVNYKRFTPFRDGLFCERIFGPVTSFVCACGKKQAHTKTAFCEKCEVEYIDQRSRRYRLGYISLLSPVTHIWYLKGRPSYLSLFLGKRKKTILALAYCNAYFVEHGSSSKDNQNIKENFHQDTRATNPLRQVFKTETKALKSFVKIRQLKKNSVSVPLKKSSYFSLAHNVNNGLEKDVRAHTFRQTQNERCDERGQPSRFVQSNLQAKLGPLPHEKNFYIRQQSLPFLPSLVCNFYLRDAILDFISSSPTFRDTPLLLYCDIKRWEALRNVNKFIAEQSVSKLKNDQTVTKKKSLETRFWSCKVLPKKCETVSPNLSLSHLKCSNKALLRVAKPGYGGVRDNFRFFTRSSTLSNPVFALVCPYGSRITKPGFYPACARACKTKYSLPLTPGKIWYKYKLLLAKCCKNLYPAYHKTKFGRGKVAALSQGKGKKKNTKNFVSLISPDNLKVVDTKIPSLKRKRVYKKTRNESFLKWNTFRNVTFLKSLPLQIKAHRKTSLFYATRASILGLPLTKRSFGNTTHCNKALFKVHPCACNSFDVKRPLSNLSLAKLPLQGSLCFTNKRCKRQSFATFKQVYDSTQKDWEYQKNISPDKQKNNSISVPLKKPEDFLPQNSQTPTKPILPQQQFLFSSFYEVPSLPQIEKKNSLSINNINNSYFLHTKKSQSASSAFFYKTEFIRYSEMKQKAQLTLSDLNCALSKPSSFGANKQSCFICELLLKDGKRWHERWALGSLSNASKQVIQSLPKQKPGRTAGCRETNAISLKNSIAPVKQKGLAKKNIGLIQNKNSRSVFETSKYAQPDFSLNRKALFCKTSLGLAKNNKALLSPTLRQRTRPLWNKTKEIKKMEPDFVAKSKTTSLVSGLELTAIREILAYTGGGALKQILQRFNISLFEKFLLAETEIIRNRYKKVCNRRAVKVPRLVPGPCFLGLAKHDKTLFCKPLSQQRHDKQRSVRTVSYPRSSKHKAMLCKKRAHSDRLVKKNQIKGCIQNLVQASDAPKPTKYPTLYKVQKLDKTERVQKTERTFKITNGVCRRHINGLSHADQTKTCKDLRGLNSFDNSGSYNQDLQKKSILRRSRRIYKHSRRLKIVQLLTRNKRRPEWMILSHLPVLPPDLRPILQMSENLIVASDLNNLYQRVIYRNNRHYRLRFIDFHLVTAIQRLVQDAVDRLIENGKGGSKPYYTMGGRPLKSLSDTLKGKKGRFRLNLLGKRVDFSGRSVIVVSPSCKIHECGLPKDIALELYHYFLLRQLILRKHCSSIVMAKKMIKERSTLILDILRDLIYHHPVLLNRAPTLHRLGIQAFQPKLVLGNAILLHPLVCSAFNADFDGDQMGVHLPLCFAARGESWDLLWSRNNLLSPATGQPMLIPSQDMVLGFYYMTAMAPILYNPRPQSNSISLLMDNCFKEKHLFSSINEMIGSFQKGNIFLHTPVWLQWGGKIESDENFQTPLELRINSFASSQYICSQHKRSRSFTKTQSLQPTQKVAFLQRKDKHLNDGNPLTLKTTGFTHCISETKQINFVRTTVGRVLINKILDPKPSFCL